MNFSEMPCTIANTMSTVKNVFVVPSLRHCGELQHLSTLMPQSMESEIFPKIDRILFHNMINLSLVTLYTITHTFIDIMCVCFVCRPWAGYPKSVERCWSHFN